MIVSLLITLINIVICFIYNLVSYKEPFSTFVYKKSSKMVISSIVVFVLSFFYFDLK